MRPGAASVGPVNEPAGRELGLCVAGLGSWGRNVLAAFLRAGRCRVRYVCDVDPARLGRESAACPGARPIATLEAALADSAVGAVAIATDSPTHFGLVRRALEADKHVFVEKPLAMSAAEAAELVRLAELRGRALMVGHVLEYHPAMAALEGMISRGELGTIYYVYTQRINLGVVRREENAWWSLAPHDISMVCRLFGAEPEAVAASGQCFLQPAIEDVVFASLKFADGRMAHLHVSWLDPHKVRKLTLVGTRKMVTFDDMSPAEPLRVYDKGVERGEAVTAFPDVVTLRLGDIVIPRVAGDRPLDVECRHFVDSVLEGRPVATDGRSGLRVVRVLEAGQRSLKSGGGLVKLSEVAE